MERPADIVAAVAQLPVDNVALRRNAGYAADLAAGHAGNRELESAFMVLVIAEAAERAGVPLAGRGDVAQFRAVAARYDEIHRLRVEAEAVQE